MSHDANVTHHALWQRQLQEWHDGGSKQGEANLGVYSSYTMDALVDPTVSDEAKAIIRYIDTIIRCMRTDRSQEDGIAKLSYIAQRIAFGKHLEQPEKWVCYREKCPCHVVLTEQP